jgi:hypothetical protein
MGSRWRPPKKNNDKAWAKIARGDIWWDDKAIVDKQKAGNWYLRQLKEDRQKRQEQ